MSGLKAEHVSAKIGYHIGHEGGLSSKLLAHGLAATIDRPFMRLPNCYIIHAVRDFVHGTRKLWQASSRLWRRALPLWLERRRSTAQPSAEPVVAWSHQTHSCYINKESPNTFCRLLVLCHGVQFNSNFCFFNMLECWMGGGRTSHVLLGCHV